VEQVEDAARGRAEKKPVEGRFPENIRDEPKGRTQEAGATP